MNPVITIFAIATLILGIIAISVALIGSYQSRVEAKERREHTLRRIVRNHIANTKNGTVPVPLQKLIKTEYTTKEITPELLEYFEDNYLELLIAESKQLETDRMQRMRQNEKEKKINSQMEEIQKRQEAQLNAFSTVKQLSEDKQ